MGCGSGILAVAAARTWRTPVVAVDIDPRAIAATRANARRNQVAAHFEAAAGDGYRTPAVGRRAPYGLIVCNILANPLCRMAGDLARHLADDGVAVLSGLLSRDAARVLAAHRIRRLSLVRRIVIADWQTLVVSRDRTLSRFFTGREAMDRD